MNDLDLLRTLHDETPEPSADRLAPGRARLVASYDADTRTSAPARPYLRLGLVAAGTAAVTLAIAAVQTSGGPDRAVLPRTNATAAELERAALLAEAHPDPVPRGDQYMYSDTLQRTGRPGGPWRTYHNYRWSSVDGARNGLYIEHGHKLSSGKPGAKISQPAPSSWFRRIPPCGYAEYAKLPRDPQRLLARLRTEDPAAGGCSMGSPFLADRLTGVLVRPYLPPGLRPAALRALGHLHGVSVRKDVTDASGRPGVGIVVSGSTDVVKGVSPQRYDRLGRSETMIIVDPTTYRYLGSWRTYIEDTGRDGVRPGQTIADWTAVIRTAIVDRPGQRP